MGRRDSLALVGSPPRDGVSTKTLVVDTIEKQNILGKILELMKKDNSPNPQNLRRIDRERLNKKTKLVDEVIDSVQTTSSSSVGQLLPNC